MTPVIRPSDLSFRAPGCLFLAVGGTGVLAAGSEKTTDQDERNDLFHGVKRILIVTKLKFFRKKTNRAAVSFFHYPLGYQKVTTTYVGIIKPSENFK